MPGRKAATRDYLVHPHRLAFAQGGLYLLAFVPAYKDIRTFAVDRIRSVSLDDRSGEIARTLLPLDFRPRR